MPRMPYSIRGGKGGISFTKSIRQKRAPGQGGRSFKTKPTLLLRGTGAGLIAKTYTPSGNRKARMMSRVKITRK